MKRITKKHRDKWMRKVQLRRDKVSRKEMRLFERDTDISRVRLPKPWRTPFMFFCIMYMVLGVVLAMYLLVSKIVVDIGLYLFLIVFFVMAPVFMLMYPQAHTADERTTQVQFGDKPPMPANDHSPGKYLVAKMFRFTHPEDTEMVTKEDNRLMECGRIGDLDGAWPRTLRPLIWVAPTQFANGGKDGKPKHAGYMVGNTYHIPVKPRAMRFRTFERVYRGLAQQLKRVEGVGGDITPSTWILYGFETVSIPEGISQGDDSVNELTLWEAERRNNKLMGIIHDQAIDDDMLTAFET